MKKTIQLPAPELSQLKQVDIDLDMTGRHYQLLATSEGMIPEDVALSILKDLMGKEANKLTMNELRYLFMLVKINSLENKYEANVTCTRILKTGKPCNHENKYDIFLSDADLNPTPKGYEAPKIMFAIDDGESKEYTVMPPTMDMETALITWYTTTKGKTVNELTEDKNVAFDYLFIRSVMHLVDSKGNRIVDKLDDFEYVFDYLDCNKYSIVDELNEKVMEVSKFGVQNKVYKFKCKECGGTLVFQLPLLYGLTM